MMKRVNCLKRLTLRLARIIFIRVAMRRKVSKVLTQKIFTKRPMRYKIEITH